MNVTSIGGRMTVPHLVPYCCAKAAAVAFSEGLRMEMAPRGIRVLTAVPGLMRTGSHVNALFRGQRAQEYAWFALSATSPIAMDARRAARQLLLALARNHAEVRLTLPAELAVRAHGLMPGLVADVAGLVNAAALPEANGSGGETVEGSLLAELMPRWLDRLTVLGKLAYTKYQVHKGEPLPTPV